MTGAPHLLSPESCSFCCSRDVSSLRRRPPLLFPSQVVFRKRRSFRASLLSDPWTLELQPFPFFFILISFPFILGPLILRQNELTRRFKLSFLSHFNTFNSRFAARTRRGSFFRFLSFCASVCITPDPSVFRLSVCDCVCVCF